MNKELDFHLPRVGGVDPEEEVDEEIEPNGEEEEDSNCELLESVADVPYRNEEPSKDEAASFMT